MRFLIAFCICIGFTTTAHSQHREIQRRLLLESELVILGEVVESSGFGLGGAGHFTYGYKLKVIEVIKGKAPSAEVIDSTLTLIDDHPSALTKGSKQVFFLYQSRTKPTLWASTDLFFSVQPASMAGELKQYYGEMENTEITIMCEVQFNKPDQGGVDAIPTYHWTKFGFGGQDYDCMFTAPNEKYVQPGDKVSGTIVLSNDATDVLNTRIKVGSTFTLRKSGRDSATGTVTSAKLRQW